jgi:hypothetical protein
MEVWRQRRPGSEEAHSTSKGNYKTDLTLTGLLMEGLGLQAKQAYDLGRADNAWSETTVEIIGSHAYVERKAAPSITQPLCRIVGFNVAPTLTLMEKRR